MKKILFLFGLIFFMGCSHKKVRPTPEKMDTTFYEGDVIFRECEEEGITYDEYISRLNKELDSMTKAGDYFIIRGSDRNFDTIIEHVRYRYITDE